MKCSTTRHALDTNKHTLNYIKLNICKNINMHIYKIKTSSLLEILVVFYIMHVKLTNNSPPFCQSSIKG